MQLVTWQFQSLKIPMVKTDDGVLYCTSKELCRALGLQSSSLRSTLLEHRDRLNPVSVRNLDANDDRLQAFLRLHKVEFGIQRVRGDMLLWSIDEALGVAFHVHTEVAWEFHQGAIELIKQHASLSAAEAAGYATKEQFEDLKGQVAQLQEILGDVASGAGFTLRRMQDAPGLPN